ncbi:MAG: transporter ATP-binding protein [Fibrobacteria bacterium]|jgi:ABC-type glutathione transport system ATPase component|nr:transporter ATP-binding protein [Fibrobacteria bacterium]
MPLLEVENLSVHIPTDAGLVRPVDGVSFSVAAGEVLALVGESGSGKSMSALAVMGLLPFAASHAEGSIRFEGAALEKLSDKQRRILRGREMAMVFQDPMQYLNPVMTCGRQVGEALRALDGADNAEAHARVIELFRETGLPDPERQFRQYPHELSGGMRQRVLIAMMLMRRPRLLVADEPTTALDATVQAQILDLLRGLARKRGMGLLLITHDLGAVARVADRAAVMRAGKIVETLSAGDLFTRAAHPYTRMLLDAMPVRRIGVVGETHASPLQNGIAPLLSARGIQVHYAVGGGLFGASGVARAVDGVDLDVFPGETVAIVGESGSGKSTLGRGLIRLGPVTAGTLTWEGETDLLALGARELRGFRREAQMVFQDPYASLNPRLSAGYLLAEPLRIHAIIPEREMKARVAHLLESVGLPPEAAAKYPHQFSGGQRQRLAIARALAVSPKLVVADEPVSSLDMSVQAQVLDLLEELRARLGLTYVFISHDLAVVERISDRVLVLHQGRVVEEGRTRDVYANPRHPYTQMLLEAMAPRV